VVVPDEVDKDDEVIEKIDQSALIRRSEEEFKALVDVFSDDQIHRYYSFRQSSLNKSAIKKIVSSVLNQQISPTMTFVVAGFGKVFIAEIVEIAREVMDERGDSEGIRPDHLREAYRRIQLNTVKFPSSKFQRRLF